MSSLGLLGPPQCCYDNLLTFPSLLMSKENQWKVYESLQQQLTFIAELHEKGWPLPPAAPQTPSISFLQKVGKLRGRNGT